MKWVLPLALLITFEAIADIFAKEWESKRTILLAIASLSAYFIANSFWLFALRNGSGLSRGGVIFAVSSALLAVLIGVLIYKEVITIHQQIGIVLGLFSLVLIFW